MLRVGLTGGVASGKSTVASILARRGAKSIDADKIVHDLFRPGQPVYDDVVRHFGREIVRPDGSIDRKKLADAAFGADRVGELNQIVHPAVIAEQNRAMDEYETQHRDGIAVVEAALIFEAGAAKRFDKIIVVTCPREVKVERFARRHALDYAAAEREVDRRTAAQWPDERKAAGADFVIDNSGSLAELEAKVRPVFEELTSALKALQGPSTRARDVSPRPRSG